MSSVGDRLRLERERQGLELTEIAARTRISQRHLAAIETDDLKGLPGEFFYRAFVRQYASQLGLDPQQFEADFQSMFAPPAQDQFPIPGDVQRIQVAPIGGTGRSRRWWFSLAAFLAVVMACSALFAWWQHRRTAAPPPPTPASSPIVEAKQTPPPESPAPPAAESPAPPVAESPTPPVADADLTLEITANQDTWFRLRSGDKILFNGTLNSGQTKTLRASGSADLLVGNAGGLEIRLNGKPLDPIGPRGQIRIVRITAAGVEVETPRKPEN